MLSLTGPSSPEVGAKRASNFESPSGVGRLIELNHRAARDLGYTRTHLGMRYADEC